LMLERRQVLQHAMEIVMRNAMSPRRGGDRGGGDYLVVNGGTSATGSPRPDFLFGGDGEIGGAATSAQPRFGWRGNGGRYQPEVRAALAARLNGAFIDGFRSRSIGRRRQASHDSLSLVMRWSTRRAASRRRSDAKSPDRSRQYYVRFPGADFAIPRPECDWEG
jgi:hypothetical protein